MREARAPGRIVLRADMKPDLNADRRTRARWHRDNLQAVRERALGEGDRRDLQRACGRCGRCARAGSGRGQSDADEGQCAGNARDRRAHAATQSDVVTSAKCSTVGGTAKNGPTIARHCGKQRAAAELDRVALQRVPADHQQIALGRFDALVNLVAAVAGRFGDHRAQAELDRRVELGLLARLDTDVGVFENHGGRGRVDGQSVYKRRGVTALLHIGRWRPSVRRARDQGRFHGETGPVSLPRISAASQPAATHRKQETP